MDPILRSIVTMRSSIPEDAFTAATLGTVREGSGVVIQIMAWCYDRISDHRG